LNASEVEVLAHHQRLEAMVVVQVVAVPMPAQRISAPLLSANPSQYSSAPSGPLQQAQPVAMAEPHGLATHRLLHPLSAERVELEVD
jgi:hypothetical protein